MRHLHLQIEIQRRPLFLFDYLASSMKGHQNFQRHMQENFQKALKQHKINIEQKMSYCTGHINNLNLSQ